jgi:hypothetical protein
MIFIRREILSVVKSQTNETKQLKPLTVTYYNATTTTTYKYVPIIIIIEEE